MASAAKAKKKITVAPARVTLELKMAMSLASAPGAVRWNEGAGVKAATVKVQGTAISATTNKLGQVQLPIVGVAKGRVIDVEPASAQASNGPASTGHGAGGASAPAFQFRPFQVTVDTDAKGFVIGTANISLTVVAGSPPHALILKETASKLSLDWKPDFILSANRKLAASKSNEVLVLHHTGGNTIRSGINTFLNPVNKVTPQYLVDVDGHVVKLAHEDDAVNHVGFSFWNGKTGINKTSVGIEIVHTGNAPFTAEQYDSVLRLVSEIRAAHPAIGRQQVIGHMELAATSATNQTLSSRRIDDPGESFEWDRFEQANLVRARLPNPPPASVFGIGSGEFAQKGRLSPRALQPDIRAIQSALSAIGYSVARNGTSISGVFDDALVAAVSAFQRRYFAGANTASKGKNFRLGRVDFETAVAIKNVGDDVLP
jgi:N-acetyl-anhydromuramyl-L-alanine amidase AmpD